MTGIFPTPPTHPLLDGDILAWLGHLEVIKAVDRVARNRSWREAKQALSEADPHITPEVVALRHLMHGADQTKANLIEAQLACRIALESGELEESYR